MLVLLDKCTVVIQTFIFSTVNYLSGHFSKNVDVSKSKFEQLVLNW